MAGKIFISYRREDEQGYAVRLYDRLAESFARDRLFFDVDSIPPGFDFDTFIEEQIAASDIVLVVIGADWLNAKDKEGRRRLDNPNDLVRLEVVSALRQGKHVVPVLVQGTRMPLAGELPRNLQRLARKNAFFATHVGFHAEADRLIAQLQARLAEIEKAKAAEDTRRRHDADRLEAERERAEAEAKLQVEERARLKREEEERREEAGRRGREAAEFAIAEARKRADAERRQKEVALGEAEKPAAETKAADARVKPSDAEEHDVAPSKEAQRPKAADTVEPPRQSKLGSVLAMLVGIAIAMVPIGAILWFIEGPRVSVDTAYVDQVFGQGHALGITFSRLTAAGIFAYEIASPKAMIITDVAADSPAAKAGIDPFDVILSVSKQEFDSPQALEQYLAPKRFAMLYEFEIKGRNLGTRWVTVRTGE